MSPSTDELIERLSADLRPVEILPPLSRAAALGLTLAVGAAAASCLVAVAVGVFGSAPSRPGAWLAVAGHGAVAAGALAAALGACVPGRIRLERAGLSIAGAGLAATVAIAVYLVALPTPAAAGLASGLTCLGLTLVPALLPAYFVTRFIGHGVPRRPVATAVLGVVDIAALVALPGHVACGISDPLHSVFAHLLAPLLAGLVAIAWVPGTLAGARRTSRPQEI